MSTAMRKPTRSIQSRGIEHLKYLEEETEIDEVVPSPDPRNLHTLIMSLPEERFKEITQLLSLTPNLGANIVRNRLLEEECKRAVVTNDLNAPTAPSGKRGEGDQLAGLEKGKGQYCTRCRKHTHDDDSCLLLHPELSTKPRCKWCGKVGHWKNRCWNLHSELKPAWLQGQLVKEDKVEEKGKGKGRGRGRGRGRGKGKGKGEGERMKVNCSLKMVDWG